MKDPGGIDIRGTIKTGSDGTIDINSIFEGKVELGDNVFIEPNCIIKNSKIGDNVCIKANSIIEGAQIPSGTVLEDNSQQNHFSEKN